MPIPTKRKEKSPVSNTITPPDPLETFRSVCRSINLEDAIFPAPDCYCVEYYNSDGQLVRLREFKHVNGNSISTGKSATHPTMMRAYKHLKALREIMGFGTTPTKKVSL